MKDYKVLKDFIDKETGKLVKKGETVKYTVARAKEINSGIEDEVFLEEVKTSKEEAETSKK